MKNIKDIAILFDLDGVIFSSENYYSDFWAKEAAKFLPDEENFPMKIKGHGLDDIFEQYFNGNISAQKAIIEDLAVVENNMDFNYIPGVKNFLDILTENNVKKCLVTSSKRNKMDCVFQKRPEMRNYFPLMVTANDIRHAKPFPDCYLKASELCNTAPYNCVVFEDSLAGMKSAHSAGMKVIALSTTLKKSEIIGHSDMIISDFNKITLENILSFI